MNHRSFLIILQSLVERQLFLSRFKFVTLYFVCYHVFSRVGQQKGTSYEINSTSIFILHCLNLNYQKVAALSLYLNMAKIFAFYVHRLHIAYTGQLLLVSSLSASPTSVERDIDSVKPLSFDDELLTANKPARTNAK